MIKVTKEDLAKVVKEWVEALNEYNAMFEKTPILKSGFKKSYIVTKGEKVEELHSKWRELWNAYLSQR